MHALVGLMHDPNSHDSMIIVIWLVDVPAPESLYLQAWLTAVDTLLAIGNTVLFSGNKRSIQNLGTESYLLCHLPDVAMVYIPHPAKFYVTDSN